MWKPCGKLQLCIKNMIRAEIFSIFVWYLVCWLGSNLLLLHTSLYGDTATRSNFNKSMYTLLLTCIKIKYHVPMLWYTGMTGSEFSAAVTIVSVYRTLDIYISDWFQTLYDNSFHWTFFIPVWRPWPMFKVTAVSKKHWKCSYFGTSSTLTVKHVTLYH